MNFARPTQEASMSHEAIIAQAAQRLKWQREKHDQRRRDSQNGFHDDETTITKPAKLTECKVTDCPRKPRGRGWCSKHYRRWQRAGKPTPSDDYDAGPA